MMLSGSQAALNEEAYAMPTDPSPIPAIRIEYLPTRPTGDYSVSKPPDGLQRIAKAIGKMTRGSGALVRPGTDLKSVIRNAARGEMSVGRADDCLRLLFNLGMLIRVTEHPERESGAILFDAELMRRFADGERIPSPSEENLTRRAEALLQSTEEPEDSSRPSGVRVITVLDTEGVLGALIDASGVEQLADGEEVENALRDPLCVLKTRFEDFDAKVLEAWIERMKFEGYVQKVKDVWRIRLERLRSIEHTIDRLHADRAETAERLERATKDRQHARVLAERELEESMKRSEAAKCARIHALRREAYQRARGDKDARRARRVEEAMRTFEEEIKRIEREERDHLQRDLGDLQEDYERRMQRVASEVESERTQEQSAREVRLTSDDQSVLGPLREELERLEADLRRWEGIRGRTS